jgi:hypothetical protein
VVPLTLLVLFGVAAALLMGCPGTEQPPAASGMAQSPDAQAPVQHHGGGW